MRMPEQLCLFDTPEPNWAEQLHRRLDPRIHDRLIAILIEMARTALHPPMTDAQESDPDE
jgi:hypothetical protein